MSRGGGEKEGRKKDVGDKEHGEEEKEGEKKGEKSLDRL